MKKTVLNHQYVSILRCRTFGIWPEWTHILTDPFVVLSEKDSKKTEIHFRVKITCYERRPIPKIDPPKHESKSVSPILWRGKIDTGFLLGDSVVKAPEDEFPLRLEYENAYQGEVDITFDIGSHKEISPQLLESIFGPIARSIVTYLGIALDDFILPVAPIRTSKIKNGTAESLSQVSLEVKNRPENTEQMISSKLRSFSENLINKTEEERVAYDVACRRYLSSLEETDKIDKYCDLWEVCEFLTKKTKVKGTVVGKIAQALSDYIGTKKSTLENNLGIKGLYDVRKDIVHNAIEKPEEIEKKISLLKEISRILILFNSGEPYKGSKLIDKLLAGDSG